MSGATSSSSASNIRRNLFHSNFRRQQVPSATTGAIPNPAATHIPISASASASAAANPAPPPFGTAGPSSSSLAFARPADVPSSSSAPSGAAMMHSILHHGRTGFRAAYQSSSSASASTITGAGAGAGTGISSGSSSGLTVTGRPALEPSSSSSSALSAAPPPPGPCEIVVRDRNGDVALSDPAAALLVDDEAAEEDMMALDARYEGERERRRLAEAVQQYRLDQGGVHAQPEPTELLETIRASMRAKVAALADDNWMYGAEEVQRQL